MRILLAFAPLALSGCMLIRNGLTQEISFASRPHGAYVMFCGRAAYTPCKFTVRRGYDPREIVFRARDKADRAMAREVVSTDSIRDPLDLILWIGNYLFIIPAIVDYAAGSPSRWPDGITADFERGTMFMTRSEQDD